MKLAEALILRADHQKKIQQLRQRLSRSAKVQEGDLAPENPQDLLVELDAIAAELTQLIQRINKTNSSTALDAGNETLSDALAHRDALFLKREILDNLIGAAAIAHGRYSRSEVRFVSTVDIANLQGQVDRLSQEHRLLDSQIQALNWQVDLLDA